MNYPASVDVRTPGELNNWRALLQWVLAIPHLIIAGALYMFVIVIVGVVCWFLAFFAVLFTGRWPDGLRSWVMKAVRVSIRFNAYILLLTDEYPPFATD